MTAPADRFASLSELQAAHAALLADTPDEELAAGDVARVRSFLRRAAGTGRALGAAGERKTAQGLIDYWSASLYTSARRGVSELAGGARLPADETALAPFDAGAARAAAEAVAGWFAGLPPEDQTLARLILMRMLRMPADGREVEARAVPRGELDVTPADAVERLLGELERIGAVIVTRPDPPGSQTVALGSDALVREWSALGDWVKKRVEFRGAARYWAEHQHAAGKEAALIRGPLLSEAEQYHDLNDTERRFLAASRDGALTAWRVRALVTAGVAVVVVALAVWAALSERSRARLKEKENELRNAANEQELEKRRLETEAAKLKGERQKLQTDAAQARARLDRTSALRAAVGLAEMGDTHTAAKVLIIMTAAQVLFSDDRTEFEANHKALTDLVSTLRRIAWFDTFFNDPKVARAMALLADPTARRGERMAAVLTGINEELRDFIRRGGGRSFDRLLREEWYDQAGDVAERLASAAQNRQSLQEYAVFRNIFWRLSLCEVYLVAGTEVRPAMETFAALLSRWERAEGQIAPVDLATELERAAGRLRAACAAELQVKK